MEGAGVKLINTDGLAFIGPGSERFWTALSGVVLAVTFLAIYRQLRLQRSQAAVEQANDQAREYQSEAMSRARLEVLTALRDGADAAALPAHGVATIGDYWDRIGELVRAGHVEFHRVETGSCLLWWTLLREYNLQERRRWAKDGIWADFEWLAVAAADDHRKSGVVGAIESDRDALMRELPAMIQRQAQAIRTFEELRAVIVRPMSPPIMVPTRVEAPEPSAA
jgi:hypothetical protein